MTCNNTGLANEWLNYFNGGFDLYSINSGIYFYEKIEFNIDNAEKKFISRR